MFWDGYSDAPAKEEAERLYEENKPKSEASGTKAETVKDISVALQKLFKLMREGAIVEVYLPEPADADQQDLTVEIVRKNRELRASEERLRLGNTAAGEDGAEKGSDQTA